MSIFKTSILAGAIILSSLPALAQENCAAPDPDRLLKKLSFSDTSIVNVLSRKDNILDYSVDTARGRMKVSSYAGIFTLTSTTPMGTVTFTYDQDLAEAFPLTPGKKFTATGKFKRPDREQPETYRAEMTVVENSLFRIEGCDYPVVKIEMRNTMQGVTQTEMARYYHPASMLTLRTTVTSLAGGPAPQKTTEYIATSAE